MTIQFVDSSEYVDTYFWDFGDGTNSIVENPEKLYLNPGSYLVNLNVRSKLGCDNSISKLVDKPLELIFSLARMP